MTSAADQPEGRPSDDCQPDGERREGVQIAGVIGDADRAAEGEPGHRCPAVSIHDRSGVPAEIELGERREPPKGRLAVEQLYEPAYREQLHEEDADGGQRAAGRAAEEHHQQGGEHHVGQGCPPGA